jgi:hypothetical protein
MHEAHVGSRWPDICLIPRISDVFQRRQPQLVHGLPARHRCRHMNVFYKREFIFIFTINIEKKIVSLEIHISVVYERILMRSDVLTTA